MKWLKIKEDKVVAKLKNADESYKGSVVIPTDYYPLNKAGFKVFTHENTVKITDEAILRGVDSVKYKIGHCYENTEAVAKVLRKRNVDVKTYVGWLLVGKTQFPIHHCWVVVGKNQIIDLADDLRLMYSEENSKAFEGKTIEEQRLLMADFAMWASTLRNSQRCFPIGNVNPLFIYVGCECEPDAGRKIYQELMRKYPNHECQRNCDSEGYNPTQKLMADMGLM